MDGVIDPKLRERADAAVRDVLVAVRSGPPMVLVPSPPGSGKSGLVERVAVKTAGIDRHNVAIATTTRSQGLELCARLTNWRNIRVFWFAPKGQRVEAAPGVEVITDLKDLPPEGAVVVGTAAKWGYYRGDQFALAIFDEAWQLSFRQFAPLLSLASRYLLVGDPGQIAPVVTIDTAAWDDDEEPGPHVSAPEALRRRAATGIIEIPLPATRRLPADTAELVSSAFYRTMPFGSLAQESALEADGWTPGSSLTIRELGSRLRALHDPWLAEQAAAIVRQTIETGIITTADGKRTVAPSSIGVVCPERSQVALVRSSLGPDLGEVFVETANRWQGLERDVVIGLHPLSGSQTPSAFAMDAGRLCVMCSRHRVACVLIGRPGLIEAAAAGQGGAERHFGDKAAPARAGWLAHTTLLLSQLG